MHHEQTQTGFKFFTSEKNQNQVQDVSKKNLSPVENRALTNLNAILNVAPTAQKRQSIQRCIDLINRGRFASRGLPKSVNEYFKANEKNLKNINAFMDGLFKEVLDRYDLSIHENEDAKKTNNRGIINPEIVLTQSFS